ncbi:uncharacterized protein KZ484_000024 [Pholidichthys leucotaenia]
MLTTAGENTQPGPSTVKMETEQPEMDAGPRTPENPISVQEPMTPLTGKTPKFNEHVCENETFTDQQLCKQENNSNSEEEEPEILQIKVEQEEFWTNQEVEKFIQKQETAVTENQDEEGSPHKDSGSAESEELKMKKRRLKTGSHHEDVSHQHKEGEVLQIQQLCDQEMYSSLDQEGKDPVQVKEEEEDLCVSQDQLC